MDSFPIDKTVKKLKLTFFKIDKHIFSDTKIELNVKRENIKIIDKQKGDKTNG